MIFYIIEMRGDMYTPAHILHATMDKIKAEQFVENHNKEANRKIENMAPYAPTCRVISVPETPDYKK